MITEFFTPAVLLALAKVTALLLLAMGTGLLLKSAYHRAALWTSTILLLPLIALISLDSPWKIIPSSPVPPLKNPSAASFKPQIQPVNSEQAETPPFVEESIETFLLSLESTALLTQPASPRTTSLPAEKKNGYQTLITIFLTGSLLTLIPLLVSLFQLFRIQKRPAEGSPLKVWESLSKKSRPELFFTASPTAPFTCGVFRKRVFLPEDSIQWSDRHLRSALAHELSHLRRKDPLLRLYSLFVRALFWFHPLVWLAHRQLILAQEEACDQETLKHGIPAADYAEDLLLFATQNRTSPRETLGMAKPSQLSRRIHSILSSKQQPQNSVALLSGVIVSSIALSALGFAQDSIPGQLPDTTTPQTKQTSEHRGSILTRDGVVLASSDETSRHYPLKEDTPHFVGYVTHKNKGVNNLEESHESSLSKGVPLSLTIDSHIQQEATRLLQNMNLSGAVIVSDPETGAILAMASFPQYDPNLFAERLTAENADKIYGDEQKPLINRAEALQYPGSIAKLLTALASQYEGLGNASYLCTNEVRFGKVSIKDWNTKRNETLELPLALRTSCNTYFVQLALETGYDAMKETGKLLNLGQPHLSIPESEGRWMVKRHGDTTPWTDVELALATLGLGETELTPLQVNSMTSAIATGIWRKPYLAERPDEPEAQATLVGKGKITRDSINLIQQGMVEAVNFPKGTAGRAKIEGWTVAGKTGTAMLGKHKRAKWFTGYAPADKPKYSITVMVEGTVEELAGNLGGDIAKPILEFLHDYSEGED